MLLQERITDVPGDHLQVVVSWFVSQFITMLEMSEIDPMMLQQTILYSLFTGTFQYLVETFQYLEIFKWSSSNVCPFSMSLQKAD